MNYLLLIGIFVWWSETYAVPIYSAEGDDTSITTNGTIAAAANYFAKLFTELDALKAKDKALEANISSLIPESENDELDALKAKVSTLTSDVATLKSEKAALASDVATLESKNAALAKKIEDLPSSGRIPNQGRPGSSSDYSTPDYSSKQAFSTYGEFWCSTHGQFPAMIYSELEKPYRLAKIGASFAYCPGKFEIIGSNDGTTWTTMKTVENPGITKFHQFKSWSVPAYNRIPFKYIGLRWPKAATENSHPAGTKYAGVGTISMWEEI